MSSPPDGSPRDRDYPREPRAVMLMLRNRVTLSDFVPRPTLPTRHAGSLAVPTFRPSRKIVTASFLTMSFILCHRLLLTVASKLERTVRAPESKRAKNTLFSDAEKRTA